MAARETSELRAVVPVSLQLKILTLPPVYVCLVRISDGFLAPARVGKQAGMDCPFGAWSGWGGKPGEEAGFLLRFELGCASN
jgi:hypothetical protein